MLLITFAERNIWHGCPNQPFLARIRCDVPMKVQTDTYKRSVQSPCRTSLVGASQVGKDEQMVLKGRMFASKSLERTDTHGNHSALEPTTHHHGTASCQTFATRFKEDCILDV